MSDSAYAGSDASDLTSVVSAMRKGMQENCRVYPTCGTHGTQPGSSQSQ